MSVQDEGPQEPQQTAATIIQKAWRRYVSREVFKYFKELITQCNQQDPQSILKTVNPREAKLFDAAAGTFVRFRLGGMAFPPSIYYKIYTHRPIADVCAGSPKVYTQPGLGNPGALQSNSHWPFIREQSGWYQRMENNSWRLFCKKGQVPVGESLEIGANQKMHFHYSKLQRQQDVDRWRKRRKVEWLKQMYSWGRHQTQPAHRHMASHAGSSGQEVKNTTENKGEDEILEWEVDELLAWTNTLSFEEYIDEWRRSACAHSSQSNIGETVIKEKPTFLVSSPVFIPDLH